MKKKPNIIFLLNDHQAFYGHDRVHRPHYRKLASEGTEFTHAYTACPLCGPARQSLLTGLYPHRHKEIRNDVREPFHYKTYLECLADAGYSNYYYGKWHAGPGTAHDHRCDGFSYPNYGNPYSTPEYKQYLKEMDLMPFKVRIDKQLTRFPLNVLCNYKEGRFITPNKLGHSGWAVGTVTTPEDTHEAFFLANLACEKLEEVASSGQDAPFHLRVDFWGPHQPYWATQEYLDLYDPDKIPEYPSFNDDMADKPNIYKKKNLMARRGFMYPKKAPWSFWQQILRYEYAQQSMIDAAGGKIIDKVKELGLEDNTIIIWSADHGDTVGTHGGLFDKDAFMSEEVVRIPLAMKLSPGNEQTRIIDDVINNLDIPVTILEIAGTRFNHDVHGQSLLPLLTGEDTREESDTMSETHGHFHKHLARMIVNPRYKYIWNAKDIDELYDLEHDPYEMMNLINDDDHSEVLKEMQERLRYWRDKTEDRVRWNQIKFLRNKLVGS